MIYVCNGFKIYTVSVNENTRCLLIFQWDFGTSILLTGTPVQNNLQELYALLSFVSPKFFPSDDSDDFVQRFSKVKNSGKFLRNVQSYCQLEYSQYPVADFIALPALNQNTQV